ncbi:hypothetical protein [Carboxylicivirga sp. M1479]|uniref:hypothetical protein n=1 Tax=Carboxylicivirga sp. M1479 TaxID=2594476 RepID=UPI001178A369|nr:hypothetical protein [Carboxylicivirga sp. M1479]TRX65835.1 hypothetical protein FNN09_17180 [Carboxylicivirga sp. M1479]
MFSGKLLLLTLCFCTFNWYCLAQYSTSPDSIQQSTEINLQLKLEYKPAALKLNTADLLSNNQAFYVFNQAGMYEQFHINQNETTQALPYKAYYPGGTISLLGINRPRDSYNPHGVDDIGSAIVNGLINGIILGNKY